jgi:mRNA interferase YafQ
MNRLKEAMILLIANDVPLGPEWQDHQLKGKLSEHRECHIGGDFLLVYRVDNMRNPGLIVFVRAGTHAELFEE